MGGETEVLKYLKKSNKKYHKQILVIILNEKYNFDKVYFDINLVDKILYFPSDSNWEGFFSKALLNVLPQSVFH